MQAATQMGPVSKTSLWVGRSIGAVCVLLMLFDGVTKVMKSTYVIEAQAQLGYPPSLTVVIGILAIVCTVLYLVPRTAFLGAILLTGFLGGATASQVRIGGSVVFPVMFGVLIWLALYLTDNRLHSLMPLRR
jgi:hypothetical protein